MESSISRLQWHARHFDTWEEWTKRPFWYNLECQIVQNLQAGQFSDNATLGGVWRTGLELGALFSEDRQIRKIITSLACDHKSKGWKWWGHYCTTWHRLMWYPPFSKRKRTVHLAYYQEYKARLKTLKTTNSCGTTSNCTLIFWPNSSWNCRGIHMLNATSGPLDQIIKTVLQLKMLIFFHRSCTRSLIT